MKKAKHYKNILNDGTVWRGITHSENEDYILVYIKGDQPSQSLIRLTDALNAGWEEIEEVNSTEEAEKLAELENKADVFDQIAETIKTMGSYDVRSLINSTPNDQELGQKVREIFG